MKTYVLVVDDENKRCTYNLYEADILCDGTYESNARVAEGDYLETFMAEVKHMFKYPPKPLDGVARLEEDKKAPAPVEVVEVAPDAFYANRIDTNCLNSPDYTHWIEKMGEEKPKMMAKPPKELLEYVEKKLHDLDKGESFEETIEGIKVTFKLSWQEDRYVTIMKSAAYLLKEQISDLYWLHGFITEHSIHYKSFQKQIDELCELTDIMEKTFDFSWDRDILGDCNE